MVCFQIEGQFRQFSLLLLVISADQLIPVEKVYWFDPEFAFVL